MVVDSSLPGTLVSQDAQLKFETGKAAAGTNKGRGEALKHPSTGAANDDPSAAPNGRASTPGAPQSAAPSAADGGAGSSGAPSSPPAARSPLRNGPKAEDVTAGVPPTQPQRDPSASHNSNSSSSSAPLASPWLYIACACYLVESLCLDYMCHLTFTTCKH